MNGGSESALGPLYLFVFDAVDDRVDATVEEHHDDGEVVERAREVDQRVVQVEHRVAISQSIQVNCQVRVQVEHEVVGLVPRPAEDEEERDSCECLDDVGSRTSHTLVSLRLLAFTQYSHIYVNDPLDELKKT